jgi:hypothetical protein
VHVARTVSSYIYKKIVLGILKERKHSNNTDEYGNVILQLMLRKQVGRTWIGFIWLMISISGGLLSRR